jgi:hypothetical protein
MSFASLKKSSGNFAKLASELEKQSSPQTGGQQNEDRFWKPEVDKAGNGFAVIRFLPAPEGEDLPWVRVFDHGFQGPGGWYIENSLTTIGGQDPVSEYNSKLWNSGVEANKEVARKQKRRLKYIANIMVVSDPKRPENEGQVFLYQFGKKIFDKITEAMNPQFEDESPVNPFDFWEGANFKLKIRQVEGYRNYDKSEFDSATALLDGADDALESLWKKQHSLVEFVDPKNFKSYAELTARLNKVLGASSQANANVASADEEVTSYKPAFKDAPAQSKPTAKTAETVSVDSDEEEDTMSYFAKLAEDD